jgi:phosphoketolase
MIVLRTPEGWTGPNDVDGPPADGTCAEATATSSLAANGASSA